MSTAHHFHPECHPRPVGCVAPQHRVLVVCSVVVDTLLFTQDDGQVCIQVGKDDFQFVCFHHVYFLLG